MQNKVCVAQTPAHKFDVTMHVYFAARQGRRLKPTEFAKWMRIHPPLRDLLTVESSMDQGLVTIHGKPLLAQLRDIHQELLFEISQEERQAGSPADLLRTHLGDNVTVGNSFMGHKAHPGIVSSMKDLNRRECFVVNRM